MRRLILPLTLALAGCTVGSDFAAPDTNAPAAWHDASANAPKPNTAGVTTAAEPDPKWWLSFDDPELASLVDRAVAGNPGLQEAVLRIAEARAGVSEAAAAGLPTLNGSGSYKRENLGLKGLAAEHSSSFGRSGGSSSTGALIDQLSKPTDLYQGALDASWEIDLFGKVRRSVEAADAEAEQAIGNRDDVLVSLEAEVAETYARLRGAQIASRTAAEDLSAEQEILALTEERARHGLATAFDVESARAQRGMVEAQLPQFEQQIGAAMNGLSILIGSPPGTLDQELDTETILPPVPPSVPIGLPASLARRRPDIRTAEAKLEQQTAMVGVAVADFYPDISLTGQVGERATKAKDLTHWANSFYSFGPSISLPIFEGGRLAANLEMAKAEQAEAAIDYRKTVLQALADVDNALTSYRTEQSRRDALKDTVAADANALTLARDRYVHGLATFIDVATAEAGLDQARQQLIQSNLSVTTDLVTLYKALGGGWETGRK